MNRNRVIIFGILGIVSLIAVIAFFWLFSYGYIEVVVSNGNDGQFQYKFINDSGDTETINTDSPTIKKLLPSGDYQVIVSQSGTSYFANASVGRFLQTTTVQASFSPEKFRKFIGDNPMGCMDFRSNLLVSWPCGGNLDRVMRHLPASQTSPSGLSPLYSGPDPIDMLTFANIDGSTYVVVKARDIEEDLYLAMPVNQNTKRIDLSSSVALSALSGDTDYAFSKYKKGFLAVSSSGNEAYYYKSLKQAPEKLSGLDPDTEGLELYSVDTDEESLAVVYNAHNSPEYVGGKQVFPDAVVSEELHQESDEGHSAGFSEQEVTEIVLSKNNQKNHLKLDYNAQQVRICGPDMLCALQLDQLNVYRIDGDNMEQLYAIEDVVQIETTEDGRLLLVRDDGVMEFNPETRGGFYHYTFADYRFCGIHSVDSRYLLCIDDASNSGRSQHVLLIDSSEEIVDDIDKKILGLVELPEVRSVAPYDRFIHLSVKPGDLELDPTGSEFGYSPRDIARTNQLINDKIDQLGIDTEIYVLVNPFD